MIAALASVIDSENPEEIERIIDGIVDPVGTFYRFSMARATLGRVFTDASPEAPQAAEARS
jgi:F420-non-reducing hydrogenase small subunit